jgi:hypothetical protein
MGVAPAAEVGSPHSDQVSGLQPEPIILAKTGSGCAGSHSVGDFMRRQLPLFRSIAFRQIMVAGAVVLLGWAPAAAQSGDAHPPEQSQKGAPNPADAAKDNKRKVDEYAEAAQAINGPAGNPECVWLGRNVVRLMWRDDLDTAFRHLDLYDRFGCPGGHVQAAFRCLTRFGDTIDSKIPDSLNVRVHACWINPAAQPQPPAAAAAPEAAPAAAPAPAAPPAAK